MSTEPFSREGREAFSLFESQSVVTKSSEVLFDKSDDEDDEDFWNVPITVRNESDSDDDDWFVTPTVKEESVMVVKENVEKGLRNEEKFFEMDEVSDEKKEGRGGGLLEGGRVSFLNCGSVSFFFNK